MADDVVDLGLTKPQGPGYIHGAGVAATNLLPGLVSNFMPSIDAKGGENLIPGMASGVYSTADLLSGLAQRYIGGVKPEDIAHLPGGERASELAQGSQVAANQIIPHMVPKSETENTIQDYSNIAGSMGAPFPGSLAGKLPSVIEHVARYAMPGPAVGAVGMGLKAGIDAVNPANTTPTAQPTQTAKTDNVVDMGLRGSAPTGDPGNPLLDPSKSPVIDSTPLHNTSPALQGGIQVAGPGAPTASLDNVVDLGLQPDPSVQHIGLTPTTQAEQDQSSLTPGKIALYGLGAIGVAVAGSRILKSGRDAASLKFADMSEKWHAETAANNGIPVNAPPLPGSAGSFATNVRQSLTDRQATMTEFMRSIADTPIVADQQRAFIGDINGAQPLIQRFQAGYAKGELLGQKIPNLMENDRAIAALTPTQRDILDAGMKAGNELDDRYNNWMQSGRTSTDIEQRVRFPEKDDVQLRAERDAMTSDPELKAISDNLQLQSFAKVDMLVKNGMLPVSEGQAFKNAHKFYVPDANLDNIVADPLLARNITPYSGGTTPTAKVWDLIAAHDYKLVEATEANRVRATMVNNIRQFQAKDIDPARPGLKPPTYLQDSKNLANGEWVAKKDGSSIAFRNNGVLEHVVPTNRRILDAMKGPAVQINTTVNALNKARQFQQSFITGAGAIASGHLFPLINSMRSVGEITTLRPAGMYGSHFDKWLQRGTGGRLALRGDPISGYPGMLYRILTGTAAESSRAISHVLDGSNTTGIGSRLRAVFGNTVMDAMHDRAKAVYDQSTRAAMRDEGLLNSAGFSSSDVSSNAQFMSKGGKAFIPQADMVPELYRMNEMAGAAPTYVRLRSLFDEMRSIIGEAAHANFFELNRDNPNITKHQLNYETRHITGDPGTRGAGAFARTYGAAVPFGNVAMQEVGRVMRAMHEEPIGTTLGFLTHYGTLAAASVFTAMLAGPQAIQHLFDNTTDPQRSNAIRLYTPGQPENPIELPVQIMMRAPVNLLLQLLYDGFNMSKHGDDPNIAMQAQHTLADFFSHHIWQSTVNGMIAGLSSGIPPVMPVGASPALTALTGKSVQPDLYEGYMHADKPLTQMFSYDITGANQRLPGQVGKVDPVTGTGNGIVFQHVLSDLMGVGGIAFYNLFKEITNATSHGDGLGHALSNVFEDYKMRMRDDVPGGNTLWNGEQKLPRATPLQQRTEQALDAMRPTTSWKGDIQNQGLTRKFGQPLIAPIDPNVPADPTMRQMYATVGKYMTMLDTKPGSPLKQLSDARKQIDALGRTDLSPQMQRSMKNEYEREIQDRYANTLAIIHQMESKLSDIVGGASVDVRHIDWKKGVDQFGPPP
jgi:hypothetical protein